MKRQILTVGIVALCSHFALRSEPKFLQLNLEQQQYVQRALIKKGKRDELKKFWTAVTALPKDRQKELYNTKVDYTFTNEPIDVVIPCHAKDVRMLETCLKGIKWFGENIRRVIVISKSKITDNAEWFDEAQFPFTKTDVAQYLNKGDRAAGEAYLQDPKCHIGWYYQQLLKLYAPYVIPDISSNVLVLDADTVFTRAVRFQNDGHAALFNYFRSGPIKSFVQHAQRMLPFFEYSLPGWSCVVHHMLLQRPILDDLFAYVEATHQTDLWKAFCQCVDTRLIRSLWGGASEYKIYFNFAFARSNNVQLRELKSVHVNSVEEFKQRIMDGYEVITYGVPG